MPLASGWPEMLQTFDQQPKIFAQKLRRIRRLQAWDHEKRSPFVDGAKQTLKRSSTSRSCFGNVAPESFHAEAGDLSGCNFGFVRGRRGCDDPEAVRKGHVVHELLVMRCWFRMRLNIGLPSQTGVEARRLVQMVGLEVKRLPRLRSW